MRACLDSIPEAVGRVVYVDSGSTDGSVELAQSYGVSVVNLDMSRPFTAARARNAGFERLMRVHNGLVYVQFLDGDCSLVEGWLEEALDLLGNHPDWLAVCGWRRERHPAALVTALFTSPLMLTLVLGLYGLQIVRIARRLNPDRFPLRQRLLWGVSCLVSQVPKIQGLLTYLRNRRRGTQQQPIEYK
ncbi:MAG: glycosyltransferase family A protein [Myxococcota bacterium]|nr:glycosyltransferase family A protein [Myxococcota bacterium]